MLRGVGAALSLPMLEVMGGLSLRAVDKARPAPRLAYLYFPNGVADGAWAPEKVGENGQLQKLNQWMAPLQPFVGQLTLFRNFWTPRGNGHGAGTATWLTGGAFNGQEIHAGGISADQLAARHFQNQTLLPSLELAVRGEGSFSTSLSRNSISWADASVETAGAAGGDGPGAARRVRAAAAGRGGRGDQEAIANEPAVPGL